MMTIPAPKLLAPGFADVPVRKAFRLGALGRTQGDAGPVLANEDGSVFATVADAACVDSRRRLQEGSAHTGHRWEATSFASVWTAQAHGWVQGLLESSSPR